MEIKSAEFVISNTNVKKCPTGDLPEYAFIGRSNVGKSSLINMLTGKKGLAMTSQKPGKTLLINHFLINGQWYLVDLCEDERKGDFVFPEPFHKLQVDLLRFVATVDQDKQIRELFAFQDIIFDDPLDIFASLFSPLGKTIAREIDQIPLSVDEEMVDKQRFSRFLRRWQETFNCQLSIVYLKHRFNGNQKCRICYQ